MSWWLKTKEVKILFKFRPLGDIRSLYEMERIEKIEKAKRSWWEEEGVGEEERKRTIKDRCWTFHVQPRFVYRWCWSSWGVRTGRVCWVRRRGRGESRKRRGWWWRNVRKRRKHWGNKWGKWLITRRISMINSSKNKCSLNCMSLFIITTL